MLKKFDAVLLLSLKVKTNKGTTLYQIDVLDKRLQVNHKSVELSSNQIVSLCETKDIRQYLLSITWPVQ